MASARRAKIEFSHTITDEEHFNSHVFEKSKKLTIVDLHLSWCGNCKLMETIFRNLALRIDEWENRLEFLIVDCDKVPFLANK